MWRRDGPEVVEATVAVVWFGGMLCLLGWLGRRKPTHRKPRRPATRLLNWVHTKT